MTEQGSGSGPGLPVLRGRLCLAAVHRVCGPVPHRFRRLACIRLLPRHVTRLPGQGASSRGPLMGTLGAPNQGPVCVRRHSAGSAALKELRPQLPGSPVCLFASAVTCMTMCTHVPHLCLAVPTPWPCSSPETPFYGGVTGAQEGRHLWPHSICVVVEGAPASFVPPRTLGQVRALGQRRRRVLRVGHLGPALPPCVHL